MEEIEEIIQEIVAENSLTDWTIAAAIILVVFICMQVLKQFAAWRLAKLAARTPTLIDDAFVAALRQTNAFPVLLIAIYLSSLVLALPYVVKVALQTVAILALILLMALWANAAITFWVNTYQRRVLEVDAAQATTIQAISYIVRVVVFSLLLLLALDNIPGVEVTPLLASLGVAGIAVSLALQNILADLFASIAIALDKPFVINDFIIVGDFLGTVEKIGIKTTRLRSLGGEQLIFPNADIVNSRIRNFKRMEERRVDFRFNVTYWMSYEKLRRIPGIVEEIINEVDDTRFDRAHFASFGEFALVFEVVYFVLSADFNKYMDIQQAINLGIFEAFEREGIAFALPEQTVRLKQKPE